MKVASPARLYASAAGALLLVLGIVGFFYSASLGTPGTVEEALGALRVNGWLNLFYAAVGALGLLVAGASSRGYAIAAGVLFTALAIWGWALGSDEAILGLLPTGGANQALNLALGLLGLLAAAGTPRLQPRAQAAGQRP